MNFEVAPKTTEIISNWDEAKLYCAFLEVDGKNDWRLPTKDELKEIYNSKNDFVGSNYWSSTERTGSGAWLQSLSNGSQYYGFKDTSYYVRAVRSIS